MSKVNFVNDLKKTVKLENASVSKNYDDGQKSYKLKCKRMKRLIKELIYENAALCDEIAFVQEKTLHLIEERNYLFKKLYNYEPIVNRIESSNGDPQRPGAGNCVEPSKKSSWSKKKSDSASSSPHPTGVKVVKRALVASKKKLSKNVSNEVHLAKQAVRPTKPLEFNLHSLSEVAEESTLSGLLEERLAKGVLNTANK